MPQFFDLDDRLASLKEECNPLVYLSKRVDFEHFRQARQEDIQMRWRVKQSRPKRLGQVVFSVPEHGYKTHISIDRRYGFIRGFDVTDITHSTRGTSY